MELDNVTGIVSYAGSVGTAIPPDFLDDDITKQFYSENYARLIVYTDTPAEGDLAFKTVESIHEKQKLSMETGLHPGRKHQFI